MMEINEYQLKALKTAVYPNRGKNIEYPTLGLCGEAGEIANKVKKIQRDDGGILSETKRFKLIDEIGDVMWYIAVLCDELNIPLEEVCKHNIEKLSDRAERGKLKGSGDQR